MTARHSTPTPPRRGWRRNWKPALVAACLAATAGLMMAGGPAPQAADYVVFASNELGMHCMQQDFSQMMVLPPYNSLRAQVIDRSGEEPEIVTSGFTLRYTIPSNTHSADKCNFWTYAPQLLGVTLPADVGLTGKGMSGTMTRMANRRFEATGIPITPIEDSGRENPYPLALVSVEVGGATMATTQAVVPISWEMSCNACHNSPGISPATHILQAHDRLHGTTLEQSQPVLCAQCHADPALGAPGQPGISTLTSAMHTAHAPRMDAANFPNECYACHPGFRTQCLRDVHAAAGMDCKSCHGSMTAVGNPARHPWADQPRCDSCHARQGFEFEQPATLFKDSVGHRGVACVTCHGSPHAITPTSNAADNVQALAKQGHAGVIDACLVCHSTMPHDPFPHRAGDE